MIQTPHQAKYFAHELTRLQSGGGLERLSQSLFSASVDLNPHQIEAAVFALQSPLSKGVLLADEVGLGKTIEAGIVLCQLWCERKRRLIVICPASLRKQWAQELQEKFNLPAIVLDAKTWREAQRQGLNPLTQKAIVLVSYSYAQRIQTEIRSVAWDLVVMDEAHKLRNAYRESNKTGQAIRWATADARKLLLTATPLQNSLLELYGLSTLIDEHIFGDVNAFRAQYTTAGANLTELRERLSLFCRRTLRKDVLEYVRYTARRALTRRFRPTDEEHQLYEAVTDFLALPGSYAIPQQQRHLTELILRKLLASSSQAVAGTLDTLRQRLEVLRDERPGHKPSVLVRALTASEDIDSDLLDEILGLDDADEQHDDTPTGVIDSKQLAREIGQLGKLAQWARSIGTDAKTVALLSALEVGFTEMTGMGARRKALVFTESRRTQLYLRDFLETNGYAGQVVLFSGSNDGEDASAVYKAWVEKNQGDQRSTGSRGIDMRAALIEHFRDNATIMIATEAAAEGVNLQFCSLVINYDLPWNPQRIEQRIGRCHRYGQLHDVVVVNFINDRNEADQRVFEILQSKFHLFSGVFGASDEVLGSVASGLDFESEILAIYRQCRTPLEIEQAFNALQTQMDAAIQNRIADTRQLLLENFDADVHERLRGKLQDTRLQLDRFSARFWQLTRYMLAKQARFDESQFAFDLLSRPSDSGPHLAQDFNAGWEPIPLGRYHLISRHQPETADQSTAPPLPVGQIYRLSHPLGEYVIDQAQQLETPPQTLVFDPSAHTARTHVVEALRGQSGWLSLQLLTLESFEKEEHLLFSGITAAGVPLDQEQCEKLMACTARLKAEPLFNEAPAERRATLTAEATLRVQATIHRVLENNNAEFKKARERLEQWADDMVLAAEKNLRDTKDQLKAVQREARQADSLAEQHTLQQKIQRLEKQQRSQRQDIFAAEDKVMQQRDELIGQLAKRMSQKTSTQTLFTVGWEVL